MLATGRRAATLVQCPWRREHGAAFRGFFSGAALRSYLLLILLIQISSSR